MWKTACARTEGAVHPVIGRHTFRRGSKTYDVQRPFGSCFSLNSHGQFLTNAHVVLDDRGRQREGLCVAVFVASPEPVVEFTAVKVGPRDSEFDLAILDTQTETAALPVTFADASQLPMGTSLATLGFPIPADLDVDLDQGYLETRVTRRLSAGFLSGTEELVLLEPSTTAQPLYELNLLSYPGNSGGPTLDLDGRVVGVNRGTRVFQGAVAAFAWSIRNQEVLMFLRDSEIEFTGS